MIAVRLCDISHAAPLFLRRVKRKVQVRIRHFVFAQVVKHWHPSPEWHRRRAHADWVAGGDFSNKLRQGRPRGERTERWYRPFQNLLGIGIRPHRIVADVAGGFYDLLAHTGGRLGDRYLLLFCPRDAGKLSQISDQSPDLWFRLVAGTAACPVRLCESGPARQHWPASPALPRWPGSCPCQLSSFFP